MSLGKVLSCVRIPSRGDRPRPIIVNLSLNDARNQWIDGKRSRSVLECAKVSAELTGSRIDINEKFSLSARSLLNGCP